MAEHAKKPHAAEAPKPVERSHCWDPVLDTGGAIPTCIPMDAKAVPFKMVMVTRGEQMFAHFKCCRCGLRGLRRWETTANKTAHGTHHEAFDYVEVEKLPTGDCPSFPG